MYCNYNLYTKLPWPGDSKRTFRSPSQAATCLLHAMEASRSYCWTSSRKAVNSNFYGLWFDSTGNRTQVYRFSSRRSIHATSGQYCSNSAYIILIVTSCIPRKAKIKCWNFKARMYHVMTSKTEAEDRYLTGIVPEVISRQKKLN